MNRVRVAHFDDRASAELVRERLERVGIPAEIHDEPWQARLWFVSRRRAGVRVDVPFRLSETAEAWLLTWDSSQGALRNAIRCPQCHSLRVDYPQFTEKSFATNLAFGLMAALGLLERDYYCEHCHNMWPKAAAPPRPVREQR